MAYRAILFDLDDTLIDFSRGEELALEKTYHVFFAQKCDKKAYAEHFHEINRSLWSLVSKGKSTPQQVKNDRFSQLIQRLDLTLDPHPVARAYEAYLGDQVIWFPGVPETLTALTARYEVGVVTNGLTNVQQQKYQKGKMHAYFRSFIISESVGISKPDPRIFHLAFKEMQIEPHETLMVGDSLESDYQGAINCGMDFCWINPRHLALPSHLPSPKYSTSSILELQRELTRNDF